MPALAFARQDMSSLGIDVSKVSLSCALAQEVREFPNTAAGHAQLWEWGKGAQAWCLEATGRHHLALAGFAHGLGVRCLVVNPGRARKYLAFVSPRGKTDRLDALALARLAEREGQGLRPYRPVPLAVQEARDALVRRRALVQARVSLEQTAREAGDPDGSLASAVAALRSSQAALEQGLAKALKGYAGYERLMTVPAVGPLSAALLTCALERGEFATPDSLVAFAGLDPRPKDSGKHRGTRALSHQGDAQLRTVLFMAARAGSRLAEWKPYYAAQRAKGLSTTEATVVLARKLLRVAWKVYRQQAPFVSKTKQALDTPT